MPNTTGTFTTSSELLVALSTFMQANGWTKVRGEEDLDCASPKAARYWRVNFLEQQQDRSYYRANINFRANVGDSGNIAITPANWSASSEDPSYPASGIAAGNEWRSDDTLRNRAWVQYDFGTPTIVREAAVSCGSSSYAPIRFQIQWSNDGYTWTTMRNVVTPGNWTNGESREFQFDDGYLETMHEAADNPRRGGDNFAFDDSDDPQDFFIFEACNNVFVFQGPGYDADRRVYFFLHTFYDDVQDVDGFFVSTMSNADVPNIDYRRGADEALPINDQPFMGFNSNSEKTYWFFLNSTRLIIVVKNGLDDYTSMYVGFMKAFATPDNYSFPLYVGASFPNMRQLGDVESHLRCFWDPGENCAFYRNWIGTWIEVRNHDDGRTTVDNPVRWVTYGYVYPFFSGKAGRQDDFPRTVNGDYDNFNSHWLDSVEPTEQGELPLISAIVADQVYGNVGALDGAFCVPRGDVVSAEQQITIGSDTYRVFTNRDKVNGNHYIAIRED